MDQIQKKHELPKWLWLWSVAGLVVFHFLIRIISPEFAGAQLEGESGLSENGTVVLLIIALFVVGYIFKNRRYLPHGGLIYWYLLLGFGVLFFAGEEASWGQHWFGWETPDGMKALNDQEETNLHNMSSWLDQKPRTLIEIGAIVGGIFYPLYRRFRSKEFLEFSWQAFFWPSWVCLPISLAIGLIKVPDRVIGIQNLPELFNMNVSEIQEGFVALGFLIYFLSVAVRLYRLKNHSLA